MKSIEVILMVIATFRATRLLTTDYIFKRLREWIEEADCTQEGYFRKLIRCPWCVSIWMGTILYILYIVVPSISFALWVILTASAFTGILEALLSLVEYESEEDE